MQEIYGRKAREMLDEQRVKIASLKPEDIGFGLSYFIPEFDIHHDKLIIDDDGNWLVDHGCDEAAEHPVQAQP